MFIASWCFSNILKDHEKHLTVNLHENSYRLTFWSNVVFLGEEIHLLHTQFFGLDIDSLRLLFEHLNIMEKSFFCLLFHRLNLAELVQEEVFSNQDLPFFKVSWCRRFFLLLSNFLSWKLVWNYRMNRLNQQNCFLKTLISLHFKTNFSNLL